MHGGGGPGASFAAAAAGGGGDGTVAAGPDMSSTCWDNAMALLLLLLGHPAHLV